MIYKIGFASLKQCNIASSLNSIPIPYKAIPCVKNTSTKPPLAQISKDDHTLNHTTLSPPFLQTTARRYTNSVFFNLVTPSWITKSDISASPKIRFLIAWARFITSSLINKLRLQIPCTSMSPSPPIYNTYNWGFTWNPVKHLWWRFFRKYSQPAKAVDYSHRGAPL